MASRVTSIDFPNPNFQRAIRLRGVRSRSLLFHSRRATKDTKIRVFVNSLSEVSLPAFRQAKRGSSGPPKRTLNIGYFKSLNLTAADRPVKGSSPAFEARRAGGFGHLIYCNLTTCKGGLGTGTGPKILETYGGAEPRKTGAGEAKFHRGERGERRGMLAASDGLQCIHAFCF